MMVGQFGWFSLFLGCENVDLLVRYLWMTPTASRRQYTGQAHGRFYTRVAAISQFANSKASILNQKRRL